ncbi:BMA-DDX-19, isoform a [Dirofilaria immitis]|nr:BMA-DDX-19, isoform a [Dirofilaria immitis]
MAEANDANNLWKTVPEDYPRNCQNVIDKTESLSVDDKKTSSGDNSNEHQSLGGFSAPKVFGGSVFGGDLNLRNDGSSRRGRITDDSYNDNRGMSFNPASRSLAQRGLGSTFGGNIPSTKPVDPSSSNESIGFRAINAVASTTDSNFSRRNQLTENLDHSSSMGQFAPPASATDLSDPFNQPEFNDTNELGINRRDRLEGEEDLELEQQNLGTKSNSLPVASPFAVNRSFSNAENVQMQQSFQAGESSS